MGVDESTIRLTKAQTELQTERLLVHVQASQSTQGLTWSDDSLPLLTIEITDDPIPKINSAPQFESEIKDQVFTVIDPESQNNIFTYTIPDQFDLQSHSSSLEIEGMNEFMILKDRTLTFKNMPEGEYKLSFVITDIFGMKNTEEMVVSVKHTAKQLDFIRVEEKEKEEILEEEEESAAAVDIGKFERDPLFMNITGISANGQVSVSFSEKLKDLEFWLLKGYNLTYMNEVRKTLMNVTYFSHNEDQASESVNGSNLMPSIVDWNIQKMNDYSMVLGVNFSNPLYISQGRRKCELGIYLNSTQFFVASADGV